MLKKLKIKYYYFQIRRMESKVDTYELAHKKEAYKHMLVALGGDYYV